MNRVIATAFLLGFFAFVGVGLVALTHHKTINKIEEQKVKKRLRNLNKILPSSEYDNEILKDQISIIAPSVFGTTKNITVYRARKKNKPVALVFMAFAADGYNGAIELLIGIRYDGKVSGVRVVDHKETPGLGDLIDIRKSSWITSFDGKSMNNPNTQGWQVKKDGGRFDQFTGATITPRAVVKTVHRVLEYSQRNKDKLYIKTGTQSK